MDEMFQEEICPNEMYEEIDETENPLEEEIRPNEIYQENEETENLVEHETTELQSSKENEENNTLLQMRKTDVSVLLKSEIQHVIEDKVIDHNKICELEREIALNNRIKEENKKRIDHLHNVQEEVQRKLYEKTYRCSEIEMYITNTGIMINALKEYQDQIATRHQQVLENKNKLHLAYSEKNSFLMKTTALLKEKELQHKEQLKLLISNRDIKYKEICEEVEKTKEHIKYLQDLDNQQVQKILQLQAKFNENYLRNSKQKEEVDAKTHALNVKQKNLENLREEVCHLKETKKNSVIEHEKNLDLLKKELNGTHKKLDGCQKEKNDLMATINQQNDIISETQAEFTSLQLTESELLNKKNDMELKLHQSEKDRNETLNLLANLRAAKSKHFELTVSVLKLEKEVAIKSAKVDLSEKELLTLKNTLKKHSDLLETLEKNIREFTVKSANDDGIWSNELELVKQEHDKLQEDRKKLLSKIECIQAEIAIKVANNEEVEFKKTCIHKEIEELKQQTKEALDPVKANYDIKLQLRNKLEGEKQRLMEELKELENAPYSTVTHSAFKAILEKPVGILKAANAPTTPTKKVTFREKLFSEASSEASQEFPEKLEAIKPSEIVQKPTSTSDFLNSLLQGSNKQRGTKRMAHLDSSDTD